MRFIVTALILVILAGCDDGESSSGTEPLFEAVPSDSLDYMIINDVRWFKFRYSGEEMPLSLRIGYTDYIKEGERTVTQDEVGGIASSGFSDDGEMLIVIPPLREGGEVFTATSGMQTFGNVAPLSSDVSGINFWFMNRKDFRIDGKKKVLLGVQAITEGGGHQISLGEVPLSEYESRLSKFPVPYARLWFMKVGPGRSY